MILRFQIDHARPNIKSAPVNPSGSLCAPGSDHDPAQDSVLCQARNLSNLLGHQSALREPEEDFTVSHQSVMPFLLHRVRASVVWAVSVDRGVWQDAAGGPASGVIIGSFFSSLQTVYPACLAFQSKQCRWESTT